MAGIEHVALGSRRIDGQAAEGRGAELGKRSINTSRSDIARVDGNAARECKSARPGTRSLRRPSDQGKERVSMELISDIEGKATRVGASERSGGDACDIDGQTERSKWAGAHESTWAANEFQPIFAKPPNENEMLNALRRISEFRRNPYFFPSGIVRY